MIDAGDFGVAGDGGFADDALSAIPGDASTQIPEGVDDAALSGLIDGDAAASDVSDEQVDDPLAAAQAQWEAEKASLISEWDNRLRSFQSIKDREVAQSAAQLRQASAFNEALLNEYMSFLKQAGMEEQDIGTRLDALHGRTQRVLQQAAQTDAAENNQFTEWARGSAGRMNAKIREFATGPSGEQLFDPAALKTDQQFQTLTNNYWQAAKAAFRQNSAEAQNTLIAAREAHEAYVRGMREKALLGQTAQKKQQQAQRQQQVRAVQQQRGRQVTVAAGGAGPMTDEQLFASVQAAAVSEGLDPNRDYPKIYQKFLLKKFGG